MEKLIPSPIKSCMAIHDLSCYGRCALTVVIPVLSAMGIQVIPLPTALLSTHTGDFEGFVFEDMTEAMPKIADHWKTLGLKFDAVYSGFLGSVEQIDIVCNIIDDFGKDALVVIDPVMGDYGRLYSTYTAELCEGMKMLSKKADILTPNITEACFLLDKPYVDMASLSRDKARLWLNEIASGLLRLAPNVVITGVIDTDDSGNKLCGSLCATKNGKTAYFFEKFEERSFHGTGDLFASTLCGAMLNGDSLENATQYATHYVHSVIADSQKYQPIARDGVQIESNLHYINKWHK